MEDKASTWEIALLRLGMPFSRYLLFFSLPATVIGLIAGLTVWYTVSDVVSGLGAAFLILIFPLLARCYDPVPNSTGLRRGDTNRAGHAHVHD